MRYEQYPQRTPTQTKAINKLYNVGPDGFINGISTEKYVNLCRVSRATAYRELKAPCEMGVLVQAGAGGGRGTNCKSGCWKSLFECTRQRGRPEAQAAAKH